MRWTLPRLNPGAPFPPPQQALPAASPWPGLLAVGGTLDADSLERAYRHGIFPWSGPGEPLLWWSTDPRMVLEPAAFRVSRSLRQSARRLRADAACSLHLDRDFRGVMQACAAPRPGQPGSWISAPLIDAYCALHARGLAHSVELRRDGELLAGLYLVAIGGMLFGESMFTRVPDGSKLTLLALCGLALRAGLGPIDCQQQTQHLASLGAQPQPRADFLQRLQLACGRGTGQAWNAAYDWSQFDSDCAHWL